MGYSIAEPGDAINLAFPNSETRRGRVGKGRAHTLQAGEPEQAVVEPKSQCYFRIRKLTPRECFRLMNFDDEDFDKAKAAGVSDSQLYRQAGNSIVVAVLEAIFKEML